MKLKYRKIVILALMSSISFLLMLIEIPIISAYSFLKYDISDVIPLMVGFYSKIIYAIGIIVVRNLLHLLFKGQIVGMIMSTIASISFILPPIYLYHKKNTKKMAIIGMLYGSITMLIIMYIANLIVVPMFFGFKGKTLFSYLLFGVIPFNVVKGILNIFFTYLFYKRFSRVFLYGLKNEN